MMISKCSEHRLPTVPWIAVAGEFMTAFCFGGLGLFIPFLNWVTWPELLTSWHFAVAFFGSFAIALALVRRRPEALKIAIVLAAYIGLPSLLSVSQAISQATSAAAVAFFVVWGIGMLGQVAVVLSSLRRLAPIPTLATFDDSSVGEGARQDLREAVMRIDR